MDFLKIVVPSGGPFTSSIRPVEISETVTAMVTTDNPTAVEIKSHSPLIKQDKKQNKNEE